MDLIVFTAPWADAMSQSIVLALLALVVFGGVVAVGYWLLSRWLD